MRGRSVQSRASAREKSVPSVDALYHERETVSSDAAPRQGFVEMPGARLFYEQAGAGDPILLLHGGMLDLRMWDAQFAFLAQRHHVTRYDMRGSGRSELSPSDLPYVPYLDIYNLLRALDTPSRATLIGLSGGARAAIDFAIGYPDYVRRLVLVSPGMSGYSFIDPWTLEQNGQLRQALVQQDLAAAIERFVVMWTDGPRRAPQQVDPAVRASVAQMVALALPQSGQVPRFAELDPPAIGRLAEIQAPTLLVLGDQDTDDIHAIGDMLFAQVPDVRREIVPGAGHMLVMEQPERFNQLLVDFLA